MARYLPIALVTLSLVSSLQAAEPYRKTLISSKQSLRVPTLEVAGKEVTPKCPTAWSVSMQTLHGGKQEGVDIVVIDNGKLKITVVPTRGMGLLSVQAGAFRLGWESPVKEVVHPRHVNLQGRGGLGWLEGFNELMCRCGMESAGGPGPDKFINNIGDEATMELTLHGKVANLPAQEVELIVEREAPYRIRLRGRVDEKMLFGPKLELATELIVEPGASQFRIEDVVTNRGTQPQEYEMIYHTNFGTPLLGEGARFLAPVKRVVPFNERAARASARWNIYEGPTPGFIEQVYLLEPIADGKQRTVIMLQNAKGDRAASLAYSVAELPYLTLWKNTGALADGYVTGLEPGTNYPKHRSIERKEGRLKKLAGGASAKMAIDFGVHTSKAEVEAVGLRIRELQGNTNVKIEKK